METNFLEYLGKTYRMGNFETTYFLAINQMEHICHKSGGNDIFLKMLLQSLVRDISEGSNA